MGRAVITTTDQARPVRRIPKSLHPFGESWDSIHVPGSAMVTNKTLDLAHLVRAHQVGVWRYLRLLGAEPGAADDLVQETFLAVWRSPFEVRSEAATKAYLRMVARNLFLKRLRSDRQSPEAVGLETLEAEWTAFAGSDDGEGWLLALRHCLAETTPRVRTALDRFYADGCSREELGKELGMGEDGVKSLLRRARETLRECVEKRMQQ